jgi:hypothetical protein
MLVHRFPIRTGGAAVNLISRQAVIGAFVGAALVLGANASADTRSGTWSHGALTSAVQLTLSYRGAGATLAEVLQTCRDKVLDNALDALGEIAARLKQM